MDTVYKTSKRTEVELNFQQHIETMSGKILMQSVCDTLNKNLDNKFKDFTGGTFLKTDTKGVFSTEISALAK